ncbi:hypothetical protein TCAL_01007 [Tigriopus californicus]|uniref:Uncharacterized protein n=1 Tax=Tigriopus californicus TaxID=6832 RepID=A0A553P3T4_TIGCA|nr:uncharacterized protein LOC131883743 [Tigriopus californicus]TRY72356.1 hypothetical protein TCAL_01007 [Tigriopus californicus]|eukprot:TCALIF_01007-PA protein Name:"Protein of unknown function" AED:0.03 eAED:0.12 QI:0/-1/0/1/-1/1/1/0/651
MVKYKQPKKLYDLCHKWFCEYLGDKVMSAGHDSISSAKHQTLSLVRVKLRPFFVEHLPVVVRSSLLEATSEFLLQKSLLSGVDCDYGRSILYLLYLLLSKEVKQLKVTLCCYYGCRDMEGVLRYIKKNGNALEHLELCRSSLLRMDPLLFRNVLTSATNLTSLVVRNICSDAMLKLIGTHCYALQYLDISHSKQVSDLGIESLCCQVQIRDKREMSDTELHEIPFRMVDQTSTTITVQEDFGDTGSSSVGCVGKMPSWREFRQKMRDYLITSDQNRNEECLVEIKQVHHPLCYTLKAFDITDTSVTNSGLLIILKKIRKIHSLGEYSISDNFLRNLNVASIVNSDQFELNAVHSRKVTGAGMLNLVRVMPKIRSLTCWEPQFDIGELSCLNGLKQLTLLRLTFAENTVRQIMSFIEESEVVQILDKICLEFIVHEEYLQYSRSPNMQEFDISRIFEFCDNLKVFMIEFKDSLLMTPPIGFILKRHPPNCLSSMVHIQLGQVVQNSAVSVILAFCPSLKHFHCNTCPDLTDHELHIYAMQTVCRHLECFYVYEAPCLTFNSFQTLIDCFPDLQRFGNLTRWAINCEGIQNVVRTIRDNNFEIEILCGSHWFSSKCSQSVQLNCYHHKSVLPGSAHSNFGGELHYPFRHWINV